MTHEDKEFFICTLNSNKPDDYLIYCSDTFKLSEIDLINLIKICMIEARNKTIGKKLLDIYRDSTNERIAITEQRLNNIGIHNDNGREKPKHATARKSTSK